jgi:hypothetical protein
MQTCLLDPGFTFFFFFLTSISSYWPVMVSLQRLRGALLIREACEDKALVQVQVRLLVIILDNKSCLIGHCVFVVCSSLVFEYCFWYYGTR